MTRVLFLGSTQIKHIAELLTKNGYDTKVLEQANYGKIKFYFSYVIEMLKSDFIYIVYAESSESKRLKLARLFRKKVILHWIGTDVYNYIHEIIPATPYSDNVHHIAGSDLLHRELKSVGIASDIIPIIPFGMELDLVDMPDKHSCLVYLPKGREEFYHADIIRELAIRNEEIDFHIVANDGYESLNASNVIFHGKLEPKEMKQLYKKISILIRLPEHDGLSMMVIEALAKGKQVLYKYDHPFVSTPEDFNIVSIDNKFKEIISKKPQINYQGHDYILSHYNEKQMMDMYKKYCVFE